MSAVALQSFIYEADAVRVVMIDDKPWWVAADIAKQLGYRDAAMAARIVKAHHKGTHLVRTPGGDQELTILSEGGLFRCILRSKRPEAEKFGDWVTDELLPTLRLTGRYDIANDPVEVEHPQMPEEIDALRTKLAIAREARVVFGLKQARRAWRLIGLLPELTDGLPEEIDRPLLPSRLTGTLHASVTDWLEARTQNAPGCRVMSQDLYADYLNWAKAEEISPNDIVNLCSFGRALTNIGIPVTKGFDGRRARIGLKLLSDTA